MTRNARYRAGSTEDIIGRDEIDDFEAILSVVGHEDAERRATLVHSEYDTIFTWDYEKGQRPKLNKLYEKAKKAQWNGETDLPWETEVDQEALVVGQRRRHRWLRRRLRPDRDAARRSGATRNGSSSEWRARTGRSRSSSTASRER